MIVSIVAVVIIMHINVSRGECSTPAYCLSSPHLTKFVKMVIATPGVQVLNHCSLYMQL